MYNIRNYESNIKEKGMATTPEIAVFVFCLVGCGLTSFFVGRQAGIEGAVQHFIDIGLLEIEEPEDE